VRITVKQSLYQYRNIQKPLFAASNFLTNNEPINDDDLEICKIINMQLTRPRQSDHI